MIVPDDSAGALGDMITLRSASGGHGKLQLGGDGIIVAQSAANSLGVKAGKLIGDRESEILRAKILREELSRLVSK